jgi:hypothetical protein
MTRAERRVAAHMTVGKAFKMKVRGSKNLPLGTTNTA